MTEVRFIDTTLRMDNRACGAEYADRGHDPDRRLLVRRVSMPWSSGCRGSRSERWPHLGEPVGLARYGTPLARKTGCGCTVAANAISRGFTPSEGGHPLLVRKCVDFGIRYTALLPWNDAAELEPQVRELERDGVACVANLIYRYRLGIPTSIRGAGGGDGRFRPYRICFRTSAACSPRSERGC